MARDGVEHRVRVKLADGAGEGGRAGRGAPAVAGVAAARVPGDRLHARPAGRREGRAGRAARVLRPRARPPAAVAGRSAAGLRGGARPAQRRAAPRAARAVATARRSRRGRSAWPSSGAQLVARAAGGDRGARRRASPRAAAELGLPDATLGYAGEPPTAAALEARIEADLRRGSTGLGPHLDDVRIASGERDLRSFGSQGEQRLALLALLLAETELLPPSPLLLLDDVLSELDSRRRRVLAERVAGLEQVVITATQRSALPVEPAQVVEVTPGQAV